MDWKEKLAELLRQDSHVTSEEQAKGLEILYHPKTGRTARSGLSPSPTLRNHTVPEVGRILRCSGANVYTLIRTGQLRAVHFGRRIVLPDDCFRAFLHAHLNSGNGETDR